MTMLKYAVVVPARNEEEHIKNTLLALKRQTVKPSQIIVVDDGSKDQTGKIASNFADLVVRLPDRGYSAVGKPELAEVINEGLAKVEEDINYVMICGADHVLSDSYAETLIERMNENTKIVVASGRARGEAFLDVHPRGSGRVVNADFWRMVNGLRYPVVPGWESWLCFKARQLGFEARAFRDVVTELQRPTGHRKAKSLGRAMYALGYDWKYAIGRSAITFVRNPKAGLRMFLGWLLHRDVRRLDVADWVNKMQKRTFWKRVKTIIKHGGRR